MVSNHQVSLVNYYKKLICRIKSNAQNPEASQECNISCRCLNKKLTPTEQLNDRGRLQTATILHYVQEVMIVALKCDY